MPAWPGYETPGHIQFFAWKDKHAGMQAVWAFHSCTSNEHTFHFPPAWPEAQLGMELYAYRNKAHAVGSEEVLDFWNSKVQEHTFHLRPAWQNEHAHGTQFYA